jgi:hypothetical protein
VQRWRESGLSAKEYATEIGVNANSLQHWGWRLGSNGEEREASEGERREAPEQERLEFVEVVNRRAAAGAEPLEVVLKSGATVRVPRNFDEDSLRRLLTVLGAR